MTTSVQRRDVARAWLEAANGTRCACCMTPAPSRNSHLFAEWEVADPKGIQLVCPECIDSAEFLMLGTTEVLYTLRMWKSRLGHLAAKQGLQLVESPQHELATGEVGWMLVDEASDSVIAGDSPRPYSMDLIDVEEFLYHRMGGDHVPP